MLETDQVISETPIPASLDLLIRRRKGGRVNIRGIGYQLQFSIYKVLSSLSLQGNDIEIRLEGIEDLDEISRIQVGENKYYQVKFNQKPLNASTLWNLGVIQNFLEVYLVNINSQFVLVANQLYSDSKLDVFFSDQYISKDYLYWGNKITSLKSDAKTINWDWESFDFNLFLNNISFETISNDSLMAENTKNIIDTFSLSKSNYKLGLNALFHDLFRLAEKGGTFSGQSLLQTIASVKDQIAAGTNPVLQYRYLEKIDFSSPQSKDFTNYYEGQPAKPVHIALGLPAPRLKLEKKILSHLKEFDSIIIKSSSGQGKSTLAWRVCYLLHEENRKVYQLHNCETLEQIGLLVDFFQTRVLIGEAPIIVIDGLSEQHKLWAELAGRMTDLPLQFIVTTREEDWVRYGSDAYKVNMGKPLGLDFNMSEAQQIYNELKRCNKLHESCTNWQYAWERVQSRGLLMEFVYLITRGEMLATRLRSQLSRLHNEQDGQLKLAILRIVSLADDLIISLKLERLSQYLKSNFNIQSDIGELFRQLQNEYYVRLELSKIVGLHPVRSNHIATLLHESVSINDTLLELASIVLEEEYFHLGKAIPSLLSAEDSYLFYKNLVGILKTKQSDGISNLLWGIYRGEVKLHQKENRAIYDDVFKNGGYLLFQVATIPFPTKGSDILQVVSKVSGNANNHIQKAVEKLPTFNIKKSNFLRRLVQEVFDGTKKEHRPLPEIGVLLRWFWLFGLESEFPDEKILLQYLEISDVQESQNVVDAFFAMHPEKYKIFASKNICTITGLLKAKTNTISIRHDGNRLCIEYMLPSELAREANSESVSRIEKVHCLLPLFEVYEADAVMLPFPNKYIIEASIIDARKRISPTTLPSPFLAKMNREWINELDEPYRASSVYEWQQGYYSLREAGLEVAEKSCKVIELVLEGKSSGNALDKALKQWEFVSDSFLTLANSLPLFPELFNLDKSIDNFFKNINKWLLSFRNYINQYTGLIKLDAPDTRRIALLNIRTTVFHLTFMQEGIDEIGNLTFQYFDLDIIKKKEKLAYRRLLRTSAYYGEKVIDKSFKRQINISNEVATYWSEKRNLIFNSVSKSVDYFSTNTGLKVYSPSGVVESEYTTEVVFGAEINDNIDIARDFQSIALGMLGFCFADIDFVTLFFCKNKEAIKGMRFTKDTLLKMKNILEGSQWDLGDSDIPLPVVPNSENLATLSGISYSEIIPNDEATKVFEFYQALWKLGVYSLASNDLTTVDKNWRLNQISDLNNQILKILKEFETILDMEVNKTFREHYEGILRNPEKYGDELIAELLLSRLLTIDK